MDSRGAPAAPRPETGRDHAVTNSNEQGRYARMVAFWSLTLLVAYGCFHAGGLVTVLDRSILPASANPTLVDPFPLFGTMKVSTLVALAINLLAAWTFHSFLARPKIATSLVETESEMRKVTWPAWPETWAGTLAVAGTVLVLFVFLTLVDLVLARLALLM